MKSNLDSFQNYLNDKIELINKFMLVCIPENDVPNTLYEAMNYSLMAGGKRIRPVLTLASYESFGRKSDEIIPIASCLELLHTYSLIHDDLPSMDNDDFRRGKFTNHKIYGEATAILSGDALLTLAFGNMAKYLNDLSEISKEVSLQIIEEFAMYSGALGMVGGQIVDLLSDENKTTYEDLIYTHTHKTGDLIVFSIRLGALLAGANEEQLKKLTSYGRKLGLAFQIQDDILDIIGDEDKLGKKVGSDQINGKATYPFFKGIDVSIKEVEKLVSGAKFDIKDINIETELLCDLADYIIYRDI